MRKNATHQIMLQTGDLIKSGVSEKDASIFQDISTLISVFDISAFPGKTSPIFAVHGQHPEGYIAQYVSRDHGGVQEGYHIYFTGAYDSLKGEVLNKKHFMYDGVALVSEPYTLSDLLILYGAHEVRHKIQELDGLTFFKNGDSTVVADPELKTIIAVLEKECETDKYFQDIKEFDSEVVGRYVSYMLHENVSNFKPRTLAAMLKAQPSQF